MLDRRRNRASTQGMTNDVCDDWNQRVKALKQDGGPVIIIILHRHNCLYGVGAGNF